MARRQARGLAGGWRVAGWLLAALLLPAIAASGTQVPGIESVRFRNYSVGQGLPQASIVAMAQDRAGYLWFGTQDGLARFDGNEFTVFQHDRDDEDSIADNHIQALVADADGSLWIGTQTGGLDHYRPDGERFEHIRAGDGKALASDTIEALAMDNGGRLWIASLAHRLQWIERGGADVLDAPLGRHDALANVHAMLPLADGGLLLGSARGLWRVDAAGRAIRAWGEAVEGLEIFAIAAGRAGDVWVGSGSDGLYHLDAAGYLLHHYRHDAGQPDSLPDDEIRGVHVDARDNVWIAGNSRGLARLDPVSGSFAQYMHQPADPQSIAANRLWCVGSDRDGLLLVGSWTNGFSVHNPDTEMFTQIFSIPGDAHTLPAAPAPSVYGDADGSLWAGQIEGGGLVHLDLQRGVLRRYRHDNADPASLSNDSVQHITRGSDGALWVATSGGGLDRLRADGGFDHLRHDPDDPDSLASDMPRYVYFDSHGTLWVATKDAGLDERCATCSSFRHHRPGSDGTDSIADIDISTVLETRDGTLWVGTRAAGLYRRVAGESHFRHIAAGKANGLSSNSITALFQDSRGTLWVGTQGGALNRAEDAAGTRFDTVDSRHGLASDAIGAILEDGDGAIWVSTIAGISRVDPRTLAVRNFGAHDGASERGYWIGSRTMLADGRMAFGGITGITLVDAGAVRPPPSARPVITALILHGRRIGIGGSLPQGAHWQGEELVLDHKHRDIGAEFASLEYSAPESMRYSYRLDGHDEAWIDTPGSRRVASYTNLAAGSYRLHVRARHEGGPWSETGAQLRFTVRPAPWASPLAWFAYLLAALLLALAAGLRVRGNLARRLRQQQAIRNSEERLKLALWGSGSELWDVDLASGRMYRENRLSDIAASEEAEGQTLQGYRPFVHPDDLPVFERALADHLSGHSASFEAGYRTLDRAHRWVWLLSRGRVVERDADGRALRISGTSSDITALKQAETSLRNLNEQLETRVEERTAALRQANAELRSTLDRLTQARHQLLESEKLASLGGLVAGVAHEINTPLGIGVTAASYLHDEVARLAARLDAGEVSDAELRRFGERASEGADLILRNLQRADRLVKSFKQVAVDQTGEDVRRVDLLACIGDIVTALGPSLRRRMDRVEVDCPGGLVVRTSPGALHQIITNLVMNSITHGFADDTPGRIAIRALRAGDGVLLEYRDDGRGMAEEVRAHVFEPFFTTRRGRGGSGLGMHIVYSLVTQVLGGSIELESAPGNGVLVRMRFDDLPAGSLPA